ncbi:putative allantoicase [Actinoplanes ianthinogenes]|uniref:Probable allantoicase n=1 Tax=Actinoplanes ianthinogenes TaxID=122358 RepID=A0ABM7LR12_9ACTN|nr:allantoicase [Actinoplanes ianthinogenes]BCJ41727.1 putative allantoicase [Actinoplanes ianthinogenes]GGR28134.1 putative allantoicase [Actinoplanes ianthinogenes]
MKDLPDLASRAFGGGVVYANDEFFAAADHLVLPAPAGHAPKTFDHKGQVYDGWETRRRRVAGHDFAVIRLGAPGVIRGVDVDTSFFTGNYPPFASLDATALPGYPGPAELAEAEWTEILPRAELKGNGSNEFPVSGERRWTHVRLNIFPDGGVARLRVHGEVVPDPDLLPKVFDVAAAEYGGRVVDCSNMFYGNPQRMLMPGLALNMGDGWETSRRRDDANDWVLVQLAAPARLRFADLDTSHFKGNAPGWATLTGITADGDQVELLPRTALRPDTPHRFPLRKGPEVTHARLDIFPDGGMARLRLLGRADRDHLWARMRQCLEP